MEPRRRGRPRKNTSDSTTPRNESAAPQASTGSAQVTLFGPGDLAPLSPTKPASQLVLDTVPIIEVTAQLVEALERGDPQAKVYVEELLEKYIELYGEAGAANFQRAFDGVARARRQRLPDRIPQQTAQEVRSLAVAISDGHTLYRWEEVLGEVALRHVIAEEPFQVKFVPGPALMAWTGPALSEDSLREELSKCDLDAVLLFYETLGSAIAQIESGESMYVTIALDDLILALGWDKAARRNAEERNRLRLKLWHWMMVFDGMKVIGQRPGKYRDPDTKQLLDLTSEDALIRLMGQRTTEDILTPDGRPMPLEISFAAGPWVERFKGNRQILTEFGNVRLLARIPSGKAAGAWARCIGMTLYQRWREGASRAQARENTPATAAGSGTTAAGQGTTAKQSSTPGRSALGRVTATSTSQSAPVAASTGNSNMTDSNTSTSATPILRWRPFTRRGLLTGLFHAEPDAMELLSGPNPMRAREYWDQAIQMLKQEGFISEYREIEPLPKSRKAWQDAWLDQPLEILPGEEPLEAAEAIMKSATAFQSRTQKKRGRPRKKPLPTD